MKIFDTIINSDGTSGIREIEVNDNYFDPPAPPPPTPEERIVQLEQEKNLLQAQVQATSTMMDFYEECIVEMAMIVYA